MQRAAATAVAFSPVTNEHSAANADSDVGLAAADGWQMSWPQPVFPAGRAPSNAHMFEKQVYPAGADPPAGLHLTAGGGGGAGGRGGVGAGVGLGGNAVRLCLPQ